MIDMNKKYTYNGKPARIYADGSDTAGGYIHGAYISEGGNWCSSTFLESDLVEVWEPKEGEWCFFWDNTQQGCHVRKFVKRTTEGYIDASNTYWVYCAKFTGTLPESFKGPACLKKT